MTAPVPPPDPGLSTQMAAYAAIIAAENGVRAAALSAIEEFLQLARYGVLGSDSDRGAPPTMTGWPTLDEWVRILAAILLPAIEAVWQRRFDAGASGTVDDATPRAAYMTNVASRLRDWPRDAFEDIRGELLAAQDAGESIPQMRDRIGYAFGIDALTRDAEARLAEARRQLASAEARGDTATADHLRGQIRALVNTRDASNRRWWWRAERIARTETIGAYNAAAYTAGAAMASVTGTQRWAQWIATTTDARTRPTHLAAHLQVQALGEPFSVGVTTLRFPGDPSGPANEVINCRCTVIVLDADEVPAQQAAYERHLARITAAP